MNYTTTVLYIFGEHLHRGSTTRRALAAVCVYLVYMSYVYMYSG
jgi:hypothetical protein